MLLRACTIHYKYTTVIPLTRKKKMTYLALGTPNPKPAINNLLHDHLATSMQLNLIDSTANVIKNNINQLNM